MDNIPILLKQLSSSSSLNVRQSLGSLALLLEVSAENQQIFIKCGGVNMILKLLTKPQKRQIVESGLYALAAAVKNNVSNL